MGRRVDRCVSAAVLVVGFLATHAAGQHRLTLTNKEEPLGEIPFDAGAANSLVLSADGKHGAYVTRDVDGFRVVLDGRYEPGFDAIARDSLVFSPNGTWLAYAAREDGRWYVIEGDERSRPYADVVGSSLRVSSDGLHFAFIASRDKQTFVVLDGVESPAVDAVVDNRLFFSPVGGRLAYAARKVGRTLVVLDGAESLLVDEVGPLVFSANGGRLAYAARSREEWFVVLDNVDRQPARPGIRPLSLTLSREGQRFGYIESSAEGMRVITTEGAGDLHEWVFDGSVTFGANGGRLAYAIRQGGKCRVVVDGQPGATISDGVVPGSITFSPDGRRVAYVAEIASAGRVSRSVVIDGVAGAPFDRIRGVPRFSADGRHVAYVGERVQAGGVAQFVVIDDTPGKPYACVRGEPVFSPDGTRVAVMALAGDERFEAGEELPRLALDDAGNTARRLVLDRTPELRLAAHHGSHPKQRDPIRVLLVEERIAVD